ncbi:universal stress protein [Nocardia uniformis]|uniref:Universal stress protein n=1 Tax=Nocardia uniformis TaxID=53432 RepID=A0A849BYV0_9NOCA|nr:universal stress protein [Nocardia uniformis]NNH69285.1 universal stress protein [Nocardia uniformis]
MTDEAAVTHDPNNPPIIVAVDGSANSYQAVGWAAVEADLRRCPLHIITSYAIPTARVPVTSLGTAELAWVRADGRRVLTEASAIARHSASGDTVVTTELIFDPIVATLIGRSRHARLVVVGNRGRGAIRRAVLGSVSTSLTRHAHCPVVVVHDMPETDPTAEHRPIVVGVDGSANSMPAVAMAFEQASRRKVGLIAVHAWSDTTGWDLPVIGWEALHETQEALLAESLAGFAEQFPEVSVERVVACDTPVRALLEHAEGAQLIVVGSHGRGGFAGMTLGSTSTALLHLAECPVLVVRES